MWLALLTLVGWLFVIGSVWARLRYLRWRAEQQADQEAEDLEQSGVELTEEAKYRLVKDRYKWQAIGVIGLVAWTIFTSVGFGMFILEEGMQQCGFGLFILNESQDPAGMLDHAEKCRTLMNESHAWMNTYGWLNPIMVYPMQQFRRSHGWYLQAVQREVSRQLEYKECIASGRDRGECLDITGDGAPDN